MKHYITQEELTELKRIVNEEINMYDYNTPYEFIKTWIKNHCRNTVWSDKKSSKTPCCTTYGLKHAIERDYPYKDKNSKNWEGYGYCANNWVKCALLDLGYELKDDYKLVTFENMINNAVNYYYRKINND